MVLLSLALAFCITANAQQAPTYLTHAQVADVLALLPPPALAGSPEDLADRAVTERAFASRSAADVAQAQREDSFTVFAFASVVGPAFESAKLPHVTALFKQAERETKLAVDQSKDHWKRARPCPPASPCAADPVKAKARSFGYPSGHSSRATVDALLLARLLPQDADALMQHARDIGWRRVVKGVHTPQDIYAGRVFGQALAERMLAGAQMQNDLAAAASELHAAGLESNANATHSAGVR
jgi:acid phosphatase (class A)